MSALDFKAYLDHYVDLLGEALDPVPGKVFVQPGDEVAWDQCDCDGQAWAKIVNVLPVVGTRKADGRVCVQWWDVTFAVGVLRCVAGPNQRGVLPNAKQITADGHRFADDLVALMGMVEGDSYVRQITQATPLGPQGGCAGSEVQFIVRVQPCIG